MEARYEICNVNMEDCSITAYGEAAHAGLMAGELHGELHNISIQNSQVSTLGLGGHNDILVGSPTSRFTVDNLLVSNASAKTVMKQPFSSTLEPTPSLHLLLLLFHR